MIQTAITMAKMMAFFFFFIPIFCRTLLITGNLSGHKEKLLA